MLKKSEKHNFEILPESPPKSRWERWTKGFGERIDKARTNARERTAGFFDRITGKVAKRRASLENLETMEYGEGTKALIEHTQNLGHFRKKEVQRVKEERMLTQSASWDWGENLQYLKDLLADDDPHRTLRILPEQARRLAAIAVRAEESELGFETYLEKARESEEAAKKTIARLERQQEIMREQLGNIQSRSAA